MGRAGLCRYSSFEADSYLLQGARYILKLAAICAGYGSQPSRDSLKSCVLEGGVTMEILDI